MEAPAAGAAEAASFHEGGIQQQHAQSRRSHNPGHEHRPAVHEGARQPHARSACVQKHTLVFVNCPEKLPGFFRLLLKSFFIE